MDYICTQLGHKIDVIFITGDLVQTGDAAEFSKFQCFLTECYDHMGISNETKPKILFVPGNHDMVRCNQESKAELQMMKQWEKQVDLRMKFFWESESDYRSFVNSCFENYTSFVADVDQTQGIVKTNGLLAGDYYTTLNLNGINVGFVGLNSSFLQLTAGEYQHKIGIYLKQLVAVLGDDYGHKLNENDFNILLTHHSPDWYDEESSQQYTTEIYSQNKFLEHYCGHNHIAQTTTTIINNSLTQRIYVGHSLFGLDFEDKKMIRIHGYEAGKYVLSEDGSLNKIIYPRLASQKPGGWDFDKDTNFSYEKGKDFYGVCLSKIKDKDILRNLDSIGGDVLDGKKSTASIPSVTLKDSRAHAFVRDYERELGKKGLVEHRFLWITTHYGLCSERFVSSILEGESTRYDVFKVNIEDCQNLDDVENQVRIQFAEPFNVLVDDITKSYDHPLLMFRGLSKDFVNEHAKKICKWLDSALTFKPNLSVIIISNLKYEQNGLTTIELSPLSLDEVKIYVEHATQPQSWGVMEWDKIQAMSGGYPLFVDMILQDLQYVDINDLDLTDYYVSNGRTDKIPNVIQTYIQNLRSSSNKDEKRKYQLLYLLSSLPKGESFASIRRFDPTIPFYPVDIEALQNKELLVVDDYYNMSKDKRNIVTIKVLHVPAIYRNYICGLEDVNSNELLYERVCEMYLGSKWKTEKIVIPKKSEQQIVSFANNNIALSLSYLVKTSLSEIVKLNRYLRIAGCFVHEVKEIGFFYTGCVAAKEIFDLVKNEEIDDLEFRNNRAYIKFEYASLLRMMRYFDSAKIIFEELLEEKILPKAKLQICRECLAYLGDDEEKHKYAAELIKEEKNKKSITALIGQYIITLSEKDAQEKRKKYNALYKLVKKNDAKSPLMANVAISLSLVEEEGKSIRAIDTAIEHVTDSYSRMRLISRKYELVTKSDNPSLELKDIEALRCVYAYSFTQMLPDLLNPAHRILWDYYMQKADYQQVALLYKYSNFVWTIKGGSQLQQEYQEKMNSCQPLVQWINEHRNEIEM